MFLLMNLQKIAYLTRLHPAFIFLSILTLLGGCAALQGDPPLPNSRPCIVNFSSSGSFLDGQNLKTFAKVAATSKGKIVKTLKSKLPGLGYTIENVSFERSEIRALNTKILTSLGRDRAPVLTIAIKGSNNLRMDIAFQTRPGQILFKAEAQKEFCSLIEAVEVEASEY